MISQGDRLLKRFWALYFFTVFSAIFLALYPLFFVTLKVKKWHFYANELRRLWARLLMFLTGISPRVEFRTELNQGGPYIFCPNHTSALDISMFTLCFQGMYRYVAKAELERIPIFGIFFRTIDISIERANAQSSYRGFKKAAECLANGDSIVIFPEGTNSKHDGPGLLAFKNGPFKLAIETGIPIVPITYLDNWHLFRYDGKLLGSPGVARAIVHPPIETTGLSLEDVPALKQKVREIIYKPLEEEYESHKRTDRPAGNTCQA